MALSRAHTSVTVSLPVSGTCANPNLTLTPNHKPISNNKSQLFTEHSYADHVNITSHHIEETDAGLDRPLYPRNKIYNKNLKRQIITYTHQKAQYYITAN